MYASRLVLQRCRTARSAGPTLLHVVHDTSTAPDDDLFAPPPWWPVVEDRLGRLPVPTADLIGAIAQAGHGEVREQEVRAALDLHAYVVDTGQGVVSVVAAADGVVLTHVVTAEEIALDVLRADGDLDLWAQLADEGLAVPDGEVRARYRLHGLPVPVGAAVSLAGPRGWLGGFSHGDLAALRLRDGVLGIERCPEPVEDETHAVRASAVLAHLTTAAAAALQAYVAEEDDSFPGASLSEAVGALVADDAQLLTRPLVPLSQLVAAAGLALEHGDVGLPGVPLGAEADDLTAPELWAIVAAHTGLQLLRQQPGDAAAAGAVLTAVAHDEVARRLADAVEVAPLPAGALDTLLAAAAEDHQRARALVLTARDADGRGEAERARGYAAEAARLRPDDEIAVLEAVTYAADAGDARSADAMLRGIGVPADDALRLAMRPLLATPPTPIGRNRPCPCGSGRKYKVCCLPGERHPLPARADLVYARLIMHSQRPGLVGQLERHVAALDEDVLPLSLELALFEGGVLEDYLDRRGALVAEDERDLLTRWQTTRLQPWEVTHVEPHHAVTLRPLLGGEPVDVRDRAFSACGVAPLDVLLARPLWNGERLVLLGLPIFVHRMRRAALLEMFGDGGFDPDRLSAFFGPQPAPHLRNRDGDDLVFCETFVQVEDDSAWGRLAQDMLPDLDDPDEYVLAGREVTEGEYLHRGSVRRDGATWTLTTNSMERMTVLLGLVQRAAPEAVVVREEQTTPDQARERAAATGPAPGAPAGAVEDGLSDEEGAAFLAEYLARYEDQWLDEQIPALDGRTPRQAAAAGGELRAQLDALLDDMAWMHRQSGAGMDPARLRALLGLRCGR